MMYNIGQIIFVVFSKKSQVYPMQVVEVITKKTLLGEEVKYLLRGGLEKNSSIMLDEIDGEVFNSADEVRSTLTKRANTQIDKLVDLAVAKSKEWYEKNDETANDIQTIANLPDLNTKQTTHSQENDNLPSVVLPDGTVAKIKMPTF